MPKSNTWYESVALMRFFPRLQWDPYFDADRGVGHVGHHGWWKLEWLYQRWFPSAEQALCRVIVHPPVTVGKAWVLYGYRVSEKGADDLAPFYDAVLEVVKSLKHHASVGRVFPDFIWPGGHSEVLRG